MRSAVKAVSNALFIVLLFLPALVSGFGRVRALFDLFSHVCAFVPGMIGEYARRAWYAMTLRSCSLRSCTSIGTYFSHREAAVGPGVYIGSYCVIGRARIGANTQIACNVHVLSGRHQHARDAAGSLLGSEAGTFEDIVIGSDCWIGTSALVMANVGDGTTIGAGAVVTKEIPAHVVAVGNPARVLKPAAPDAVDSPTPAS